MEKDASVASFWACLCDGESAYQWLDVRDSVFLYFFLVGCELLFWIFDLSVMFFFFLRILSCWIQLLHFLLVFEKKKQLQQTFQTGSQPTNHQPNHMVKWNSKSVLLVEPLALEPHYRMVCTTFSTVLFFFFLLLILSHLCLHLVPWVMLIMCGWNTAVSWQFG